MQVVTTSGSHGRLAKYVLHTSCARSSESLTAVAYSMSGGQQMTALYTTVGKHRTFHEQNLTLVTTRAINRGRVAARWGQQHGKYIF